MLQRTPLAWKNLVHNRVRLMVAVAGIGFAVLLMCMQLGFYNALIDSNLEPIERLNADLILVARARYALAINESFAPDRLELAKSVPGVARATRLYLMQALWTHQDTGRKYPLRVIGFDPTQPVLNLPEAHDFPNWLSPRGRVAIDLLAKREFDFRPHLIGRHTELAGRDVEVAGVFRLGTDFSAEGNVLVSEETFSQLFQGVWQSDEPREHLALGLLQLDGQARPRDVQRAISGLLPADVQVLTKDELLAKEAAFWRDSTPIGFVFFLGAAMGFVVGTIICNQILHADIDDHLAEFATLKAMGYSPAFFVGLVLQESLLLSVIGFVPGVLVSAGFYSFLAAQTGLLMRLTLMRASLILGLTIVMCVISGCLALRKLLSLDPADLF